jgi:hypothetical protein
MLIDKYNNRCYHRYWISNKNSTGINDGSSLSLKGALDVRRLCSRTPHSFSFFSEHVLVLFRQPPDLSFLVSQFCNTVHVIMVP